VQAIRGLIFPVNGRTRGIVMSGNDNLRDMYAAIGCRTVEHYQLVGTGDGDDIVGLWFDEEFLLVQRPVMNRVFALPRKPREAVLSLGGNILAFSSFEGETCSLSLDGAKQVIDLVRGYIPNPEVGEKRTLQQICGDLEWKPSEYQLQRWLNDGLPWWSS
jgi:hypothetical protein